MGDNDPDRPPRKRGIWSWSWSARLAGVALLAAIGCIAVSVTVDGNWSRLAEKFGIPFFTLAFGGLAADAYYRKEGDRKVQEKVRMAAYTNLRIQYALRVAMDPLKTAIDEAYGLGSVQMVGDLRASQMAVHLAHGTSIQAINELSSLAVGEEVTAAAKAQFEDDLAMFELDRPTIQRGSASPPRTDVRVLNSDSEEGSA